MKRMVFVVILFLLPSWLNAVNIIISYGDGTSKIEAHDETTESLYFRYSNIVNISGLEGLPNLQKIRFEGTYNLHEFNFLAGLTMINEIIFQTISMESIDFLYEMPSLKNLVFQGCRRIGGIIEISRIPNLEYFEFTNSQLTELPLRLTNQSSLRVINIAYNNISNINVDLDSNIMIIITGNPIYEKKPNWISGRLFEILPLEYRQYIR
jgi:Leucine-rich repeat (LRR) protein